MRSTTASVLGLLVVLVVAPLTAQEPQPAEAEREHVVRRGDTLWDLAGRYLGNPFVWPRIHSANTRVVTDPHWIYPEQVLVIPGLRERAEPWPLPPGEPVTALQTPQGEPVTWHQAKPAQAVRTVFHPEATESGTRPTVLTEAMSGQVPVAIGEFYRAEYLEQPAALAIMGRVLRPVREVDQRGGLLPSAHPRDDLYVAYVGSVAPAVGDRFVVAEVGRRVPAAGRDVKMIDPRAVVRVVELEPQAIRVHIEQQFGRVVRDQVMLPLEFYPEFLAGEAEPLATEYDLNGRILEFVDESALPGKLSRSFIDLGRVQGVQVGDIFEAYLPERRIRARDGVRGGDELLPEESVAVLRVVRVTDLGATVSADQVMKPRLEADLPVRRVRKMP